MQHSEDPSHSICHDFHNRKKIKLCFRLINQPIDPMIDLGINAIVKPISSWNLNKKTGMDRRTDERLNGWMAQNSMVHSHATTKHRVPTWFEIRVVTALKKESIFSDLIVLNFVLSANTLMMFGYLERERGGYHQWENRTGENLLKEQFLPVGWKNHPTGENFLFYKFSPVGRIKFSPVGKEKRKEKKERRK